MAKKKRITQEMLDRTAGLPTREAARILGFGQSTIVEARQRARANGGKLPKAKEKEADRTGTRVEFAQDGSGEAESVGTVPQTKADIDAVLLEKGFTPEDFEYTNLRFSSWDAQTPNGLEVLHSIRVGIRPRANVPQGMSAEELAEIIERHPRSETQGTADYPNTFVFCFADPQTGKTDINGGTEELIERFLTSLNHADYLLQREPASEIIWADLGDGIENFCNTSSQRQTNDLNLVEQVRVLRRMQMEGLLRLSKHAPITHVSVPSNHSQNRVGFQQPASTAHDDWGLEVQQQLADAFDLAGFPNHPITFLSPDEHLESVAYSTSDGTRLGFVHGHRAAAQAGLERWWAGQALGRQPTYDADILLVGHFHNLSLAEVGDGRFIITTPSLDNGSSWFTVSRGNVATAGVLTFRTDAGMWRDLIRV